jgi:hypothetical protein
LPIAPCQFLCSIFDAFTHRELDRGIVNPTDKLPDMLTNMSLAARIFDGKAAGTTGVAVEV